MSTGTYTKEHRDRGRHDDSAADRDGLPAAPAFELIVLGGMTARRDSRCVSLN